MNHAELTCSILRKDPVRWHLLSLVSSLGLPDCWIAAGFVRNAVWDHLHDFSARSPAGDVDVIWFNSHIQDPSEDRRLEDKLRQFEPSIDWSVKNQARMHVRNGDNPYTSSADAMRFWPETATAVAARFVDENCCEVTAPLGMDDLYSLILRPTSRFRAEKRAIYYERLRKKDWISSWPRLSMAEA